MDQAADAVTTPPDTGQGPAAVQEGAVGVGGRFRRRVTTWLSRGLSRGRVSIAAVWCVVLALWLLLLAGLAATWWLEAWIWTWSMAQPLRFLFSWFGMVLALYIPLALGLLAGEVTGIAMDATFTDDVAAARERVRETEQDAIDRLESTDEAKLLPLLRYSRAQLDEYYAIGLKQTRRSYVSAVVAMWLGFLILVGGVLLYIGPVERLGLARPDADFKLLILSSAAIVEFIAALFLWVYRSTTGQLTFYYRLQMQSHTAILSFRMAMTMASPDDTKRLIVEKMLGSTMRPERPAPIGGHGLAALIGRQEDRGDQG